HTRPRHAASTTLVLSPRSPRLLRLCPLPLCFFSLDPPSSRSCTLSLHDALPIFDLCRSGPCDVIAAHVYWPPGEVRRLGLRGASTIEGDPEIEATLRRDLGERVASLAGPEVPLRVDAFLGRVADRLIHLAGEERADLIAVGAHRKGALARLWEGSVSRDLLHHSTGSVVCVPAVAPVRAAEVPHLSSVLVATDFSAAGDAAALMALAAAAPGATLHLV